MAGEVTFDFSPAGYRVLLEALRQNGYSVVGMAEVRAVPPANGLAILRHDVDYDLGFALELARINADLGIRATFCVQLFCPLYQVASPGGVAALREMAALGQEIGLHWDGRLLSGTAEEQRGQLRGDVAFLSRLVDMPVVSLSQHQPPDSKPVDVSGIGREAYEEPFIGVPAYVSDSNMLWRTSLPDLIASGRSMQLLIHPIWWMAPGDGMETKIEAAFAGRRADLAATQTELIAEVREAVMRRAERDRAFANRHQQDRKALTTNTQALVSRIEAQAGQERDLNAWVLSLCEPASGERVLDLGCGTGAQLLPLARSVGPEGAVVGVDLSAEALEAVQLQAQEERLGNIKLLQCELDVVPERLQDAPYDLIHSSFAIYYATDPPSLLTRLHTLLAPGGRLFVCGWDSGNNRELFEFVNRYLPPDQQVELIDRPFIDGTDFTRAFAPYHSVSRHRFRNRVEFKDSDSVLSYWRNYARYRPGADDRMVAELHQNFDAGDPFTMTKQVVGILARTTA